jgi:hypothetical protein
MFLYILHECRRSKSAGAQMAALLLLDRARRVLPGVVDRARPARAALLVWLVAAMLAGGIASVAFAVGAGIVVWVAGNRAAAVVVGTAHRRAVAGPRTGRRPPAST